MSSRATQRNPVSIKENRKIRRTKDDWPHLELNIDQYLCVRRTFKTTHLSSEGREEGGEEKVWVDLVKTHFTIV